MHYEEGYILDRCLTSVTTATPDWAVTRGVTVDKQLSYDWDITHSV